MASVRHWTGRETRWLRQATRLSVRDFAASLGVAVRTVTKWETQGVKARLRMDSQALLDTLLRRADGEAQARFAAIATAGERTAVAPEAMSVPVTQNIEDQWGDDMRRRRVLQGFATMGFAGPAAMEALRHEVIDAISGDRADAQDWNEIAWEYGRAYITIPPRTLLDDLTTDLLAARQRLAQMHDDAARREVQRVTGLLAAFLAMTLGNLGAGRASGRWWRLARQAADASGDAGARIWVRGREILRGMYQQRPADLLLDMADEAAAISDAPGMGTGSVLMGRAQVLAVLGRSDEARQAMAQVYDMVDHLPVHVTGDTASMYGWPEYRLRHGESLVYTYIGDSRRAEAAQDRALALYPPHLFRERAQVRLHQAVRIVNDGDPQAGASHACQAVSELAAAQRTEVLLAEARSVLRAVPHDERHRPPANELRELLALPAGPAHG
jgi:hypothetical protein